MESNKDDDSDTGQTLIVQSIRVSNDINGDDVLSAKELAKGRTCPVTPGPAPVIDSHALINTQKELVSRRKLTLIMRSKSVKDTPVSVGDLVQVSVKQQFDKRGKWLSSRPVLSYDVKSRTGTVSGSNVRAISGAIEDFRPAMPEN